MKCWVQRAWTGGVKRKLDEYIEENQTVLGKQALS